MVAVVKGTRSKTSFPFRGLILIVSSFLVLIALAWLYGVEAIFWFPDNETMNAEVVSSTTTTTTTILAKDVAADSGGIIIEEHPNCPVVSIVSLSDDEIHPKAGSRHMVTPPDGGKLTLVCCQTTKGNFSSLLHHAWAPLGVQRLVDMIQSDYFSESSQIPLFRCTDACQFGLSSDPARTKRQLEKFGKLQDDPMWMPPGKDHRQNEDGVRRYPRGMWTYAGAGPNSRTNQFVLTLKPNLYMGGGSPWEVPLGELVGGDGDSSESFDTLSKWYNGYGEHGPSQKILKQEGNSERVQEQWPLMDYILSCRVVDEQEES